MRPGDGGTLPDAPRLISNIVFMGMGEPLYNFEAVKEAVETIADGEGLSLSRRRITLSTSGVVPMIPRAGAEIGTMLAISLHAVRDELRAEATEVVAQLRRDGYHVAMLTGDNTLTATALAREVVTDLRRVSSQPVLWAVNSHQHWDHTFGNGVLQDEGAELICHETAAETLPQHAAEVREEAAREDDPRYAAVAATEIVVPERTFSSALALDPGDRFVELVHPGRGHTAGDLIVLDAAAPIDFVYRPGVPIVALTMVGGEIVHDAGRVGGSGR